MPLVFKADLTQFEADRLLVNWKILFTLQLCVFLCSIHVTTYYLLFNRFFTAISDRSLNANQTTVSSLLTANDTPPEVIKPSAGQFIWSYLKGVVSFSGYRKIIDHKITVQGQWNLVQD